VSGLETAIRNALDRAERGDGQVRGRIYQSARQALDAGLRKQGVTDNLVIMQQRKRLEDKIREIEGEEIDRLAQASEPPSPQQFEPAIEPVVELDSPVRPAMARTAPEVMVSVDPPRPAAAQAATSQPAVETLGGVTRSAAPRDAGSAMPAVTPEPSLSAYHDVAVPAPEPMARPAADAVVPEQRAKGRKAKAKVSTDAPVRRSKRGRRKRSFLSHLITWIVTLGVVAAGCYAFYQSGMVQAYIDEAVHSAGRASALQSSGQGPSALTSRGGFSEDWADIFEPKDTSAFKAGSQAQAQIANGSEGPALKVTSSSPTAAGDVAIEVPVEILREIAGKSSTLAITVQSAGNQHSQLSVRCDFGSLGSCSRHRFTATQERQDALFRVSFDRTMAPNAPGRLIVNTGVGGAANPVFIYSVRALPGQ
jgi:hypothetical protein